jgi:hypothetical protein
VPVNKKKRRENCVSENNKIKIGGRNKKKKKKPLGKCYKAKIRVIPLGWILYTSTDHTVHIRKEKKFDEIVETRVFGRFSGSMEGISRQRNLSPVQLLGMGTVHVNFRLMVTISIQNHFYSRLIGAEGGIYAPTALGVLYFDIP